MMFRGPQESHQHSLQTLNYFYEYDDFMGSVDSVLDLGCGDGLDMLWWATRTTRDDERRPLNIKCFGVDKKDADLRGLHQNITYRCTDFEQPLVLRKDKFDLLWCHDSFQYAINPVDTLKHWWDVTNSNGMLALIVRQTTNLELNKQAFYQEDYTYWHYTMVNLIHLLAVSGWDCASGFFKKDPDDPWLHAIVYKDERGPLDPKTTSWYTLAEEKRLPDSANASILKHGYLRQRDLLLPWLDKSLISMRDH